MKKFLTPFQKRIFIGSLLAVFFISALQYLDIHSPKLVIPVPSMHPAILDRISPFLESKQNMFQLHKKTSFIGKAYANGDYDEAHAYAVVNFESGEVLLEKNTEAAIPIASLTKIMTAVVALDLASPDEVFTVSKHASLEIPTKINVAPGEKFTLRELLMASLMTSANDATEVIKEGIDTKYGGAVFIQAMNKKAEILGLEKTHFENAQGFDAPSHLSSVADLSVLAHYAMTNYPLIKEIAQVESAVLPENNDHAAYTLQNWNGLLGVYPHVMGIKIGNTDLAKRTTIVLSERENIQLLSVLLGAPGIKERDMWTAALLDEGFATYGIERADITIDDLQAKYNAWYEVR